jgi:hypothetical protein
MKRHATSWMLSPKVWAFCWPTSTPTSGTKEVHAGIEEDFGAAHEEVKRVTFISSTTDG